MRRTTSARARLVLVDSLRGIAVVSMVYIHTVHSLVDWRQSGDVFRTLSEYFGGFAAPEFLFLAGLSGAWAAAKTSPWRLMRRGAEVWLLAMAFRVQEWWLGGPGAKACDIWRVDVLNCIGVSLVLVALVLALVPRAVAASAPLTHPRGLAIALLAILGALVFALTPLVHDAAWLAVLPLPLASYFGGAAPFPLFGWLGFAFFGAAVGLGTAKKPEELTKLAVLGLAGYFAACAIAGRWPWAAGASDFDVSFLFQRQLLALALFLFARALRPLSTGPQKFVTVFLVRRSVFKARRRRQTPDISRRRNAEGPDALPTKTVTNFWGPALSSWLALLGRHSLLIYWVHTELAYGLLLWHWHGKLPLPATLAAFVVMILAMTGLALAKERGVEGLTIWNEKPSPS